MATATEYQNAGSVSFGLAAIRILDCFTDQVQLTSPFSRPPICYAVGRRLGFSVSRPAMVTKKNLEGYKRQGKRFIPPMKQLPQVREHSYVNDMLPQLVWLGLIHDRAGYRLGAKVLEVIIKATKELPTSAITFNYALQIAYAELSDDVKAAIIRGLEQENLLEIIRDSIAPLILLYDGCPFAFVGPPENVQSEKTLISRISETVANHLDKYETPGAVLHGAMLLTRLMSGTVKFAQHIDIPDLNTVIDDPKSQEGRRAASFMRANAGAEWGMLEVPNDWARHFWNRNAELSACEIPDYLKDD